MKQRRCTEAADTLAQRVLAGERRALAKAITLIESRHPEHQEQAGVLLQILLPHTGGSIRVGISGSPGAGKSTLIETLGVLLVKAGHKLAVLAVDPSSSLSGGSILGDKTRMTQLAAHPQAFIRPSPAAGSLGGVAAKTREAMLLCEAAGFDVLIVETVGVGQSEVSVAGMVDVFCLVQLPNAGDELQALKKGIVELADLVAINKADLDSTAAARARMQWQQTLSLLRPVSHGWSPKVLDLSALESDSVKAFWRIILDHRESQQANGGWVTKRQGQATAWMWQAVEYGLQQRFRQHPAVSSNLPQISADVARGELSPALAARRLLELLPS